MYTIFSIVILNNLKFTYETTAKQIIFEKNYMSPTGPHESLFVIYRKINQAPAAK